MDLLRRSRTLSLAVLAAMLCASSGFGFNARDDADGSTSPASAHASPVEDQFERKFRETVRSPQGWGTVSEEGRLRATEIRRSMRHYLVDADLAIEALILDIESETSADRSWSIAVLIRKVAERERILLDYLEQLEALTSAPQEPGAEQVPAPARPTPARGENSGGVGKTIQLRFEAEDIGKSGME